MSAYTGILPSLPDDDPRNQPGEKPEEVLRQLRGIRGSDAESAGAPRELRTDREAESLTAWARDRGLLTSKEQPPQEDELTGGEHLVEFDEETQLVLKATKPGKFGYAADRQMIRPRSRMERPRITVGLADATPDEYLARLGWQNELFGDDIKVLGVVEYSRGASVVTSQPFYKGHSTVQTAIDEWFSSQGWIPVKTKKGAFYDEQRELLVLDALPRNVLTLDDGKLHPFDVVVVRPSRELIASLKLVD